MKNISSFWSIFIIFMANHVVFSDVDHHVAVSLVSLLLLITKNKMAASGGAGGRVPPPVWWKQTHLRCLLTKTQVLRVLPVKKEKKKGFGETWEGRVIARRVDEALRVRVAVKSKKKWKSESCFTLLLTRGEKDPQRSDQRACDKRVWHVKNVVFVTAPGVCDCYSLSLSGQLFISKEIEWALDFLPGAGSATMRDSVGASWWWWPILMTACLAADTAPGAATGGHSLKGELHGMTYKR